MIWRDDIRPAIPDSATAAAALHPVDWVEIPAIDLLPDLARDPKLKVETNRVSTTSHQSTAWCYKAINLGLWRS